MLQKYSLANDKQEVNSPKQTQSLPRLVKMALLGLDEFLPIVVEGMKKNLKTHWSNTMRQHRKHYAGTVLELQNENPQLTKRKSRGRRSGRQ